jgi:hypothetical protein
MEINKYPYSHSVENELLIVKTMEASLTPVGSNCLSSMPGLIDSSSAFLQALNEKMTITPTNTKKPKSFRKLIIDIAILTSKGTVFF